MSRRSTPERLHAARRAAVRARLISSGTSEARADERLDAWEAEARARGLEQDGLYWDVGWDWIIATWSRRSGSPGHNA